jgi:hypothetical protein
MPGDDTDITTNFIKTLTDKFRGLSQILSGAILDNVLPRTGAEYRNKKAQALQRKWTDASNNYRDAPYELSYAEKKFYDYNNGDTGGEDVYNLTIIDRFANTAAELKKNSIEKQQEFMANLSQALKQYQAENLFAVRTGELLETRQKENADLIKKLEMYNRILQTSERKVIYEIKDSTSQYTYRRVMLFLYYAAIICYILFGNFIPDKLYINKSIWIILIIVSVIPIILNLVIKWVFIIGDVFMYWFGERPYKDVYADLGDSP